MAARVVTPPSASRVVTPPCCISSSPAITELDTASEPESLDDMLEAVLEGDLSGFCLGDQPVTRDVFHAPSFTMEIWDGWENTNYFTHVQDGMRLNHRCSAWLPMCLWNCVCFVYASFLPKVVRHSSNMVCSSGVPSALSSAPWCQQNFM